MTVVDCCTDLGSEEDKGYRKNESGEGWGDVSSWVKLRCSADRHKSSKYLCMNDSYYMMKRREKRQSKREQISLCQSVLRQMGDIKKKNKKKNEERTGISCKAKQPRHPEQRKGGKTTQRTAKPSKQIRDSNTDTLHAVHNTAQHTVHTVEGRDATAPLSVEGVCRVCARTVEVP
jgi:hypothetical protein